MTPAPRRAPPQIRRRSARATSTPTAGTQRRGSPHPVLLRRSAPWGQRRTAPLQSVRPRRWKSERGRWLALSQMPSRGLLPPRCVGQATGRAHAGGRRATPHSCSTAACFPPPQGANRGRFRHKTTTCEWGEGVRGCSFRQLTAATLNGPFIGRPRWLPPGRDSPRLQTALI